MRKLFDLESNRIERERERERERETDRDQKRKSEEKREVYIERSSYKYFQVKNDKKKRWWHYSLVFVFFHVNILNVSQTYASAHADKCRRLSIVSGHGTYEHVQEALAVKADLVAKIAALSSLDASYVDYGL